jgi:hypothetical protein
MTGCRTDLRPWTPLARRPGRAPRWAGWLALLLAGCGGGGHRTQDYLPEASLARKAVEASLEAWKAGRPPGRLDSMTPAVVVTDTHRRPGQRLVEYEILGEVSGEGPRLFAVRLRLDNPAEEVKIRLVVVGIDPLWVIRQEDYQMLTHWQHHPEPAPAAGKKAGN